MSTIGERITEAREHAQLSRQALADACGVKYPSVQMWETGRIKGPKPQNLAAISAATGYRMEYLANGEEPKLTAAAGGPIHIGEMSASPYDARPILVWETTDDLPPGDYVLIPRLSLKLSAGNGRAAVEIDKQMPQAFRADWIRKKRLRAKTLTCMLAAGDSMSPYINDGDSVVIDTGDKDIKDGEPYALRYGNELRVKRLQRRFDGAIVLRSDNTDKTKYPDETVAPTELEHIEILGRVVWRCG